MEHVFRFRNIGSVLDRGELENQQIFCAPLHKLNDPMEGYRDIFWQGDNILWGNLFRHYLLCFMVRSAVAGVPEASGLPLNATVTVESLPEKMKEWYVESRALLEKGPACQTAIRLLEASGNRPRRSRVEFALFFLHPYVFDAVNRVLAEHGIQNRANIEIPNIADLEKVLGGMSVEDGEKADMVWDMLSPTMRVGIMTVGGKPDIHKELTLFPVHYISALESQLLHPRWSTACFSEGCQNSSMWGTYGSSHTGIALKFCIERRGEYAGLMLNATAGISFREGGGRMHPKAWQFHRLHKIEYSKAAVEVDFFRSLGQLPEPTVVKHWYTTPDGEESRLAEEVYQNRDKWKEDLRSQFMQSATTKHPDWSHEEEHRLVLEDAFGFSSGETLEYKFESLSGVVFGMRTDFEKMKKVIEIIRQKCRDQGRDGFEFLQASYSQRAKGLELHPLIGLS